MPKQVWLADDGTQFDNEKDWKRRLIKGHATSFENKNNTEFPSRFFTYNKRWIRELNLIIHQKIRKKQIN